MPRFDGDDRLAFDIAGRFELGERQIRELQLDGKIALVEGKHVERIARAVQVAATAAERQRFVGGPIAFGGATLMATRHGDDP